MCPRPLHTDLTYMGGARSCRPMRIIISSVIKTWYTSLNIKFGAKRTLYLLHHSRQACILTLKTTKKNYRYWLTESDTSHISHIGKLGSWAQGTSDSHQIWYLGLLISLELVFLNNTTINYRHRSTGSGTSHISQIGKLLSRVHGTSDSHQI